MKVPLPEKKLSSGDPNVNEMPSTSAATVSTSQETSQRPQQKLMNIQQQQQQQQQQPQSAPISRLYPDLLAVYLAENLMYNDLEREDNGPGLQMYPDISNLNITAPAHPDETADSNHNLAAALGVEAGQVDGGGGGQTGSQLPQATSSPALPPAGLHAQLAAATPSADLPSPTQRQDPTGQAELQPIGGRGPNLTAGPRRQDGLELTHATREGRPQNALLPSAPMIVDVITAPADRRDVIVSRAQNDVTDDAMQARPGKTCFKGGLAARKVIVDAEGNLRCLQGHLLARSQDGRSFEEIPADYDLEADYDPEEDYEEWDEDDVSTTVANMAASHLAPKALLLDKRIELPPATPEAAPARRRPGNANNKNALDAWASWRRHVNKQLAVYSKARAGNPVLVRRGELRRKELSDTIIRSCVDKSRGKDGSPSSSLPAKPYIMYGIPRAKLLAQP